MRKIAIISPGYMWFPCEAGPGRMYDLALDFTKAGFEVDVIVTDFQHFKKTPRDKDAILSQGYPVNIMFAHAPSYEKNVSLSRIKSNRAAARNIGDILSKKINTYDAVIVSLPPNDIASITTEICHNNNVPCIADIEDLWPEAMFMVLSDNPFTRLALGKFKRDAEYVYSVCDAVTGTSPDYTARAFKKQKRDIPALTVYVGCRIADFDTYAVEHSSEIIKPESEFWVTYAGSVSTSYDIETLARAGQALFDEGYEDIKIQILGTGSNLETLKSQKYSNVSFHGFIPYPEMAAFLKKSDVLVNSFVKKAPQSIVNKVGDYLAAGKPMINTLENPVFCKLVDDNKIGINVESENVSALKDAIIKLFDDEEMRNKSGANARSLAEREFDREKGNSEIINLTKKLIEGRTP